MWYVVVVVVVVVVFVVVGLVIVVVRVKEIKWSGVLPCPANTELCATAAGQMSLLLLASYVALDDETLEPNSQM